MPDALSQSAEVDYDAFCFAPEPIKQRRRSAVRNRKTRLYTQATRDYVWHTCALLQSDLHAETPAPILLPPAMM